MKKYLFGLVIILTLSIIAILPAKGYAKWVLIDDFEYTGEPDSNIWEPYSFPSGSTECSLKSPDIYVEDGKLVFVHYPEAPDCSRWLRIKNIGRAKAIRATVRFEGPCYGGVRGRIGAVIGCVDQSHHVFQCIQVTDSKEINTGTISETEEGTEVERIFDSYFGYRPIDDEDFYGEDFTIQMSLDRYLLIFRAFGFGITSFIPPERIFKYDVRVSIGTRNSCDPTFGGDCPHPSCSGDCPCRIYFDDVYVKY